MKCDTSATLDFPVTWRHLKQGFLSPTCALGFWPLQQDFFRLGQNPLNDERSTILFPDSHEIYNMRDWISDNAENKVKIFARLRWFDKNYQGIRFTFDDFDVAVYFKLSWSRG